MYDDDIIFAWFIGVLIMALIWGFATKAVIKNKGYDENWFLWGFFFGFIALLVAIAKPENVRHSSGEPKGLSYSGLNSDNDNGKGYFHGFDNMKQKDDSWVCTCGARNGNMYTTCHKCGKNRYEKKTAEAASPAATASTQPAEPKQSSAEDAAAQIKDYKKLLDEGLITEEEFNAKKKQILNI